MQKRTMISERIAMRVLAVFLSVLMDSSNTLRIDPIPSRPIVGQTVILNVTEIPNNSRFFDWYRGNGTSADNQILSYNINDGSVTHGSRFFKEAQIQPNGSLVIVNVTKKFEDKYTLSILANGIQSQEVRLEVDDVLLQIPNNHPHRLNSGQIAGIVIGVLAVVAGALVGIIYALKSKDSGPL